MSSIAEKIDAVCLKCGEYFEARYQPSQEQSRFSTCPYCGYDLSLDETALEDGAWNPEIDELEELERGF
jgi:DNA-directed RNA polymerase subunit RPC12/RpoP